MDRWYYKRTLNISTPKALQKWSFYFLDKIHVIYVENVWIYVNIHCKNVYEAHVYHSIRKFTSPWPMQLNLNTLGMKRTHNTFVTFSCTSDALLYVHIFQKRNLYRCIAFFQCKENKESKQKKTCSCIMLVKKKNLKVY